MADGAAKCRSVPCIMLNMYNGGSDIKATRAEDEKGRTCAFDGHELVFKIRFDFLDSAELV